MSHNQAAVTSNFNEAKLTPKQYKFLCRQIYDLCGINLSGKVELVQSRLSKRLTQLKLENYDSYFQLVENDASGSERIWMIDALTTNKTSFYREMDHFEFLEKSVLPFLKERRLRIWSAACSTGEEPYSIAIELRECLPQIDSWDAKILATDLSTRVLKLAQQGVYGAEKLKPIAAPLWKKYFDPGYASGQNNWRIKPEVAKLVRFAQLNLMDEFPMKGPFDFIFCRNVMIYFDKPTREVLVNRFYKLLKPGGFLFVGHSESLNGTTHNYKYIQPAIYQK